MIDRVARDQAAEWIRHFISGRLDNDEFADEFPQSREDPALAALEGRCWSLYSDMEKHHLTGDRALSEEGRREVWRWVLFLHSALEYEWPAFNWYRVDWGAVRLINWLTLGRLKARQEADITAFAAAGEFAVWPFFRMSDFERTLAAPRLLAGYTRTRTVHTAG